MASPELPLGPLVVRATNEPLCCVCAQIFAGEWREFDHFPPWPGNANQRDYGEGDGHTTALLKAAYESPAQGRSNWLHRHTSSVSFQPLLHHSLQAALDSAIHGCHLCGMIISGCLGDNVILEKGLFSSPDWPEINVGVVGWQFNSILEIRYLTYDPDHRSYGYQKHEIQIWLPLKPFSGGLKPCDDSVHQQMAEPSLQVISGAMTRHVRRLASDITTWVHKCQLLHPDCTSKPSPDLVRRPARLIEISTGAADEEPWLRVVDTAKLPITTEYVTLSHCWGGTRIASLGKGTDEIYRERIPWTVLSKTFRDAVKFTALLGYSYIWIDCFCIYQDKLLDWVEEGMSMASTFAHAVLNLAATSSTDGDGGLFPSDSVLRAAPVYVREASWPGFTESYLMDDVSWTSTVSEAVLNTRAWVLQERLLSPRTVHFAHRRIWWECGGHLANEIWPNGDPDNRIESLYTTWRFPEVQSRPNLDPSELHKTWLIILMRYTDCAITAESDRLIALSGIAQRFQTFMHYEPTEYIAGMWRPFLASSLMWRSAPGSRESRRQKDYIGPSWSWLSLAGTVDWWMSLYADESQVWQIRKITVELLYATKPFGPLKYACLEVLTILSRLEFGPSGTTTSSGLLAPQHVTIDGRVFMREPASIKRPTFSESLDDFAFRAELNLDAKSHKLYCCHIFKSESAEAGLILERDEQAGEAVYKRVGILTLYHVDEVDGVVFDHPTAHAFAEDEFLERHDDGRVVIQII